MWSIVCVHFAALPAIFVARAASRAFDIVMTPIIICTRANPSVSGMCNYFVTPFRRTRYACTRGNLGLHGNIDMIFFLSIEYHLYDFLLIF